MEFIALVEFLSLIQTIGHDTTRQDTTKTRRGLYCFDQALNKSES